MESVSVNDAIRKGFKRVILMSLWVFILGIPFIVILLASQSYILAILFFLFLFVLMNVVWGITCPRWQLWAYSRVRNLHELKRKAIQRRIMYPDGSRWEKLYILSRSQREKLEELHKNFEREDISIPPYDDFSLPAEVDIYYSMFNRVYIRFSPLLLFGVGGYFIYTGVYLLGGFLSLVALFFLVITYGNSNYFSKQLTISEKGIWAINKGFTPWEGVESIELMWVYGGAYLVCQSKDGAEQASFYLKIDLNMDLPRIEEIARVYLHRYKSKH